MSYTKKLGFLRLSVLLVCEFLLAGHVFASDSLSYSGRLVNTNGAPVVGPVDLKVELVYSNATTNILCSQDFINTILSNGVFHLKLNFNCGSNGTIEEVLLQVPVGESAAVRVTDVTHSKVYSLQALHSMPFASIAETAKQLLQMGATNNQVLKWNNTSKKWEPGTPSGGGTVTAVTGTSPIAVTAGTTPVVSIAQANTTTNGYLSSADWNTFNNKEGTLPTGGTTLQYFRGDKTLATLNTSVVPENVANLYFTNARVLGVPLDGFVPGAGAIAATDTVLAAFNKTQGQINALGTASGNFLIKNSSDTLSGTVTLTNVITASGTGDIVVNSVPLTMTSAVNKTYADGKLDKTTGGTVAGVVTLDNDLNIKGGVNYVTLRGHATSATYNLILPSSAGANGNVLKTDGAGNLSWIDPASVVSGTGTVDSASIVDGTIVNADVSATAAIAQSKIANLTTDLAAKQSTTLTNGNILIGNGSNVASPVAISGDATLANTGALTLANSGVAANTYTSVTVDAKGRVTGGTNPTTLAGYGITDTVLTGFSVTAPITNTGTAAVPLIGMPAATTLVDGYLTAADWTIFNNKQAAITAASNITTATISSGELRLNELAVNGTNYVALKAPDALVANVVYTLPLVDGSAGQILKTDGAGVLSWVADNSGAGAFTGTINRAVTTDGAGALTTSGTTSTELGFVSGVTSSIQTQLNGKEPTITAGTTAQYLRGDKTLATFANDIWATVLTGLSTATSSAITASDSVLVAFGKLQAQLNTQSTASSNHLIKNGADTISGTVSLTNVITATGAGDVVVNSVPLTMTSAVNKTYADGKLDKTTGGTVAGVVTLDDDLKIKGGSNYVTLRGHATSAAYNLILPSSAGTNGQALTTDASGQLGWSTLGSDNLGDHTATQNIVLGSNWLSGDGDSEGVTVDSSGKVGIGGSASNYKLEVIDNLNNTHGIWVKNNSTGTSAVSHIALSVGTAAGGNLGAFGTGSAADLASRLGLYSQSTGTGISISARNAGQDIRMFTGGTTERMRIDSTGNVGIGTSSALRPLHVYSTNSNGATMFEDATSDGVGGRSTLVLKRTRADATALTSGQGPVIDFYSEGFTNNLSAWVGRISIPWEVTQADDTTTRDSAMTFSTALDNSTTEKMRITSSGNVGIGTSSPQYNLHLNSSTVSVMSLFTNSATGAMASDGSYVGVSSSRDLYLWNQEAASIKLGTNNMDRVTILSDGKVGIGTTGPTYQLQLSTDSAAKPGTSTWTIASDARLKDVRAPFNRGLDSILGIKPIYYKYKKNNPLDLPSDKEYVGILAQNAKELIPESVSTDEQGFLHLNNDSIIWTLLNAVKELHQRLTTSSIKERREIASVSERTMKLEVENAAKDKKIKDLEKENADFKERLVIIEKRLRLK